MIALSNDDPAIDSYSHLQLPKYTLGVRNPLTMIFARSDKETSVNKLLIVPALLFALSGCGGSSTEESGQNTSSPPFSPATASSVSSMPHNEVPDSGASSV